MSIGPLTSATGTPTFTPIYEILDLTFPSSKRDVIMVTNFNSPNNSKEKRGVAIDYGQVTFKTNYIPDDPGQVALLAANSAGNGNPYKFQLTLPVDAPDSETTTGTTIAFNAIISEAGGFDVSIDKQSQASWQLDITGVPVITVGS